MSGVGGLHWPTNNEQNRAGARTINEAHRLFRIRVSFSIAVCFRYSDLILAKRVD